MIVALMYPNLCIKKALMRLSIRFLGFMIHPKVPKCAGPVKQGCMLALQLSNTHNSFFVIQFPIDFLTHLITLDLLIFPLL